MSLQSDYYILVAEDNDFVRMQICKFLQDAGHAVLEARDGAEALSLIGAHKVGLVLVDVRMEPMNGFDLMNAVRSEGVNTPFIMITGDNSPDILERAGDWSVLAVLIKPVEKERLLKAVERGIVLAQKQGEI